MRYPARLPDGGLAEVVTGCLSAFYKCNGGGGGENAFIRHSDGRYGAIVSSKDLRGFQTEKAQRTTWYAVVREGGFLCFYVPIHGSR